ADSFGCTARPTTWAGRFQGKAHRLPLFPFRAPIARSRLSAWSGTDDKRTVPIWNSFCTTGPVAQGANPVLVRAYAAYRRIPHALCPFPTGARRGRAAALRVRPSVGAASRDSIRDLRRRP